MSPLPDGEHWDDAWRDAVALTEAIRDGRYQDVQVLMRCIRQEEGMAELGMVTLAKLLAAVADERGATPERLREWAALASMR